MDVSVIGSGYVGTTVAACFAELGHEVVNIDVDEDVVATLNRGEAPIHEDGLPDLIADHAAGGTRRLRATTDYGEVLETDVTFLCLPTPQNRDGSIDLSIMEDAATRLGETLGETDDWHTVVVKSTVVPGSTENVITPLLEAASSKTAEKEFGVGMNPEFLREGAAVRDFLDPDKVVLGAGDRRSRQIMHSVFNPLVKRADDPPVVDTDTRTAEMIKYANNSFLATKISLINELGNVCKEFGIDSYEVADAIGLDDRISEQFLSSGVGWGGSCFEKDVAALISAARNQDYAPTLLEAAVEVNDKQPLRLLSLLNDHVDIGGERVAVLGLAFKPGTDDVRNSRAIDVIAGLQERGADIVAYDPVATDNMCAHYPDIEYAKSAANALDNAVGALIVTGWDEFAALDEEFDAMKRPVVVDGRHIVESREGITYEGLTW